MSSREAMLARVRRAMGVSGADSTRRAAVADRLTRAPTGVIPARGQLPAEERIALFLTKAEAVHSTTVRVAAASDVPAAVAAYLQAQGLPGRIRTGDDPRLDAMGFAQAPDLALTKGPSDGSDLVCVSHADAGIAETGTLVLTSGAHNPTTLNFLPDVHIVALAAETIAGDAESVFAGIRDQFGKGVLPRTVNLITGPSRSADIEQTLLLGAHGPRSLHVVVVG